MSSASLSSSSKRAKRTSSSSSAAATSQEATTSTQAKRPRAQAAAHPVLPPPATANTTTATASVPSKRRRILQAACSVPVEKATGDDQRKINNKQHTTEPRSTQTRSRRKSIRLLAQSSVAAAAVGDDLDGGAHEVDVELSHKASGPSNRRSSAVPAHTAPDDDCSIVSLKRKRRVPFVPAFAESTVNAAVALTRRLLRVPTAEGSSRHSARLDNKRELLCIEKSCASLSLERSLVIERGAEEEECIGKKEGSVAPRKRRKTSSSKSRRASAKLSIELPPPSEHVDLRNSPTPSPPIQDDVHRVSVEAESDASDDTLVNVVVHGHLDDGSGKEATIEYLEHQDLMVVDIVPRAPTPPPTSPISPKTPESPDPKFLAVQHPQYSEYIPPTSHSIDKMDETHSMQFNTELRPSVSKEIRTLASTSKLPVVAVSLVPDHIPTWCKKNTESQPFKNTLCGVLTYFPGELQDSVYYGFEGGEPRRPVLGTLPYDSEGTYVRRATMFLVAIGLGNSLARKQHGALLRWESERAAAAQGVWMANTKMTLANQTVPFQRNMDKIWREARAEHFAADQTSLGGNADATHSNAAQNDINVQDIAPMDAPGLSSTSQFVPPQGHPEDIEMTAEPSLSTAFNDDPIFLTAPPITVPSSPGAFPVISTIASTSKTIFLDAPPGEYDSIVETYVHLDDDDYDGLDNGYAESSNWQSSSSRSSTPTSTREKSIRLRRTVARRLWHHVKYQDPTASYPPSYYHYYNPELRYQQRRRQRGAPPVYPSKLRVSYIVVDHDEDVSDPEESDSSRSALRLDTTTCSSSSSLSELMSPTTSLSPLASLLTSPPSPTLSLSNGNLDAVDGFPLHSGSDKAKSPIEPGEISFEESLVSVGSSAPHEKATAVERVFPRQHILKKREMMRKSELPVWKTAVFSRMGDMCMTFGTENVQARIDFEAQLLSSYSNDACGRSISEFFDDQTSSASPTPSPITEEGAVTNGLSLHVEGDSRLADEIALSPGAAPVSESPSPNEYGFDEDMVSDADGDYEIDDEYEGLEALVCSGECGVSASAPPIARSITADTDVEMDFEGCYSEGTSDSSDYESDGPVDEMREYEFKADIDGGVQQLGSATMPDGMELEFTLPDYSPTSPSDASSPTPSPTPSPTAPSFPSCDTSSSLHNHLQLDTSSDSLLDFPPTNAFALDTFRRPFSPFVSLSRFPAHCLRDSMQPVLGLGTPDNGMGRKEWAKVVTMCFSSPTPTSTSVLDAMGGLVVGAQVTNSVAFSPELSLTSPSSSSLTSAATPVTSPELLGLFGYSVDMGSSLGFGNSPVTSSLECAVGVSAEGVIGGI